MGEGTKREGVMKLQYRTGTTSGDIATSVRCW